MSEWAAHCPECGTDLEGAAPLPVPSAPPGLPTPPPVTREPQVGPEPQVATAPRRGPHSGRRWLPLAAAVAAGTLLAAVVVPPSPRSRPPRLAPAYLDSYTVITTGASGVMVIPLDGRGASQPVAHPVGEGVATTNGVAFVESGTAEILPPPFTGPPRPLAAADRVFPMSGPEAVGLVRRLPSGTVTVGYLDASTGVSISVPPWDLPPGYQALGQYLARSPGGLLRTWAPAPGPVTRLGVPFGPAAAVAGVGGTQVAWFPAGACRPGSECPLEVTDVTGPTAGVNSGHARPPAGHRGFLPAAALSPDGRQLAVFVAGPGRGRAQLALLDMETLEARVIPDSTVPAAGSGATVRWSTDGAAVFFTGRPGSPLHAYRLGRPAAVTLHLDAAATFDVF